MDWARRDQSLTIRRGRNEDSWTGFGFLVTRNSHACLEGRNTPDVAPGFAQQKKRTIWYLFFFSILGLRNPIAFVLHPSCHLQWTPALPTDSHPWLAGA